MPQFYVYVYRDPSRKNEPIYVGKGQDDRAYVHLNRKDKHPFTHRLQLMKRNGVEPDIEIIHCNNEEVAFSAEVLSIKVLGRKDLGRGTLLNMTDGGEGTSGYIRSAETRRKMSEAHKGKSHRPETRQRMSEARSNPSPETRRKRSEALKGKPKSAEARQRMSTASKGKPKPVVTCPHCGKEGGVSIMHRWHFDNCKYRK